MGLLDNIKSRYREEVQRFVGRTSDQPATRSSPSERRARPHDLLEDAEIVLHVVGESAYQDELTRLRGTQQPFRQAWASLVAEPTNPHDSNAVAVTIDGERIGYLCREDAELLQPAVMKTH